MTTPRTIVGLSAALLLALLAAMAPAPAAPRSHAVAADLPASVEAISPNSLRGHLSFIASDLLEGRDTPSRGLDIAAEYIAAQFRRAGLEPLVAGDGGAPASYFQETTINAPMRSPDDFWARVRVADGEWVLPGAAASVLSGPMALNVRDVPTIHAPFDGDPATTFAEKNGPLVVLTNIPDPTTIPADEAGAFRERYQQFTTAAKEAGAVAILAFDTQPDSREPARRSGLTSQVPVFRIAGQRYMNIPAGMAARNEPMLTDLRYDIPQPRPAGVRNVAAILRGGDPVLADSYIIVSAHYDHIGRGRAVEGDDIYNGANDDGSGTVALIEIAHALATLPDERRPGRSIIFLALFGEEKGMLGSRFYVQNPLVPLEKTVANINLEHLGRTDDSEGESVRRLVPTGYDFSTAIEPFIRAGERTGVTIFHHPRNSASFFGRSDNIAFASAGVPAHTFCTAFIFPDYHGAGDHWDKVDYDNLAAVCRTLAVGLVELANASEPPRWNEAHRATGRYVQAWKKLHGVE